MLETLGNCTQCGAELRVGQTQCWLCQRRAEERLAENPYAPPRPLAQDNASLQFSLSSLMLVMTLVAVCMGALMAVPGLGVLLIVLGAPALARTVLATNRQKRVGRSSSIAEKIGVFLFSLLVMTAVWMSAMIAAAVVCTAGGVATSMFTDKPAIALGVGLLGGLVSAIAMANWILRLTAPIAIPPRK